MSKERGFNRLTIVLSIIAVGIGAIVGMVAPSNGDENIVIGAFLGFFYTWGLYFIIRLVIVIVGYIVKGFRDEG